MTAPLPYNTFGSDITELGTQESSPQQSTYSEEQNLSTPHDLWGSQSEVADPRHTQPDLLPNGNFGFTSYEPEEQVELSRSVTHFEGQTWPALHDPRVTETLPEEADPHPYGQTCFPIIPSPPVMCLEHVAFCLSTVHPLRSKPCRDRDMTYHFLPAWCRAAKTE